MLLSATFIQFLFQFIYKVKYPNTSTRIKVLQGDWWTVKKKNKILYKEIGIYLKDSNSFSSMENPLDKVF